MNEWRAWYVDGTTIDSKQSTPVMLPRYGLEIIVVYRDPPYRDILHGEFIYWWKEAWHTAVIKYKIPYSAIVFPGVLMPDAEFAWLQAEAMAAVEF